MIEKMKGKCLPLRDLTAEQIEKVKELMRDKDCAYYSLIERSENVISINCNEDKIGVSFRRNETVITLSEFLEIFEPFEPKRGDNVLVSDDKVSWVPRIFLTEIKGADYPITTVLLNHDDRFIKNEVFSISICRFMKPYILRKLTKQEICEKFGIDDFEIV